MDEISINLPAKPEYMSVARLTTAGLANRLGFTIDDIEDLKVAVSEAGNYLINQFSDITVLNIHYRIESDDRIYVQIKVPGAAAVVNENKSKESELSLFIIESVADQVKKEIDRGVIRGFSILKTGGGNLKNE
ncbi:MAG: histidine kinase [Caldicoprobacterales bacterium]|nr:histidine kinase [Clostridiales bacterium]